MDDLKIAFTILLLIFPVMGIALILLKYIRMRKYTADMTPIQSFEEIHGVGAQLIGILLIIFGITLTLIVWLI